MAAMRPTPVMIPVNIPTFSQRTKFARSGQTLERVPSRDPRHDAQVGAEHVHGLEFQGQHARQRGERAACVDVAGHVEPVPISLGARYTSSSSTQPSRSIEPLSLWPDFDVQLVDAARRQVFQQAGRSTLPSALAGR
jgi:hypothetical protein